MFLVDELAKEITGSSLTIRIWSRSIFHKLTICSVYGTIHNLVTVRAPSAAIVVNGSLETRLEALVVRTGLDRAVMIAAPVVLRTIGLLVAFHHLLCRSSESTIVVAEAHRHVILVKCMGNTVLVKVELYDRLLIITLPRLCIIAYQTIFVKLDDRIGSVIGILPATSVEHYAGHHSPSATLRDSASFCCRPIHRQVLSCIKKVFVHILPELIRIRKGLVV